MAVLYDAWHEIIRKCAETIDYKVQYRFLMRSDVISEKYKLLPAILEQSRFMVPANYDQMVASFNGDDLTFSYYEDGFLVATALFDYTDEVNWSVSVEHFILDDDGSQLLDDDDTALLLE